MAWHHLQYVLGLAQLGYDVRFIEDSDDYAGCYDPERGVTDIDPNVRTAVRGSGVWPGWLVRLLGIPRRSCGSVAGTRGRHHPWLAGRGGPGPQHIRRKPAYGPWLLGVPVRALIDTDPAFTQNPPPDRSRSPRHGRSPHGFFSFGENLGTGRASVPDDGFPWQPTRQPVVLDAWPVTPAPPGRACSPRSCSGDSYTAREYSGQRFGMKSESFGPYLDLPRPVRPGVRTGHRKFVGPA